MCATLSSLSITMAVVRLEAKGDKRFWIATYMADTLNVSNIDLRMGAVQARQISEGMESMDQVVLVDILKIRASVMKSVSKIVRGRFRMACRVAFDHHAISVARRDTLGQVRAWKLFLMLPRMLLSRPPRWSSAEKEVAGAFRRIQQVRVGTVGRGKFGVAPSEGTISNKTSAERAEG